MKQHAFRIFGFLLPPLAYMAAIFWVSALPNPQIGVKAPDYLLHALEYFLLTLLLIRFFLSLPHAILLNLASFVPCFKKRAATFRAWHAACLLGALVSMLYGVSDELHQYFTPGRHCSLSDVLADAFGSFLAYGIALLDYWLLARTSVHARLLHHLKLFGRCSYVGEWIPKTCCLTKAHGSYPTFVE